MSRPNKLTYWEKIFTNIIKKDLMTNYCRTITEIRINSMQKVKIMFKFKFKNYKKHQVFYKKPKWRFKPFIVLFFFPRLASNYLFKIVKHKILSTLTAKSRVCIVQMKLNWENKTLHNAVVWKHLVSRILNEYTWQIVEFLML